MGDDDLAWFARIVDANKNAWEDYDADAYVDVPSGECPPAATGRYVRQFDTFPSLEPGAQDYGLFRRQNAPDRIPNPGEWYRKEGTPYILYRPRRGSNYKDRFYKVDDLRKHKPKKHYGDLVKGSIVSGRYESI